jgi:hypothetical protein
MRRYDPIVQGKYFCCLKITPGGLLSEHFVNLALILHGIHGTHELLGHLGLPARLYAHAMLEVNLNIGLLLIEHHPAARVQIPALASHRPPRNLVATRPHVVRPTMRAIVFLNG